MDDDWAVRAVVRRTLQHQGWDVEDAPGPSEALERVAAAEPPFTLAVVDVVLAGGGSGILLAEQLYEMNEGLRFLFISGHVDLDVTSTHVPRSAISFLGKPLSVTRLAEEVEALHLRPARPQGRRDPV